MNLVDKVRDILSQLIDVKTVIYDSAWSANVRVDRKPAPYAILYLLSDWTIDVSKGNAKEGAELQIFFCDRAKFDATGEEKDVVVKQMEEIAKQFLYAVLHDRTITVVDDTVKMKSSYGQFDAFVVGVSVVLRIEEKQGSCLPEPSIPTPEPESEDGNDDQNEP